VGIEVSAATERLTMTVNTSRMLTLDKVFSRVQVAHPDRIEITHISSNKIQVFAKKPGATQINLYDQQNQIRTIDVFVSADLKELDFLLKSQFPGATLRIVPLSNGVLLGGFVSRPDDVDRIVRVAEDYYPNVINNISVGGAQQVLLHVRVMEVSRTKLREMGFDLRCGIVDSNNKYFGFLDALQEYDLVKILAEPTLVAISGRSASFRAGGEFPVIVPGALGTNSIEYKTYGMEIDFVPIVLEHGRIRLEVRPRVSELDTTQTIKLGKNRVPSLKVRQVDTSVEMQAGQTLALAGLIQTRVEAESRGIPLLANIPYFGLLFRHVYEKNNEIELLIMVTPEIIEPLLPHQVPLVGPGMNSVSPKNKALYLKGQIEVPNRCLPPAGYAPPNGEYESFLPGVYEELPPEAVVDPNLIPQPTPLDPESIPAAVIPSRADPGERSVPVRFEDRGALRSSAGYKLDPGPVRDANGAPANSLKDAISVPGLIGPAGYDDKP
jgi:pilus assembly protein CpaC